MHYNSLVIDGHNDTMMKIIDNDTWLPVINIGDKTDFHIDMEKLKKGGLNTLFFAAFSEGYYKNIAKSLSRTLSILNGLYWTESKNIKDFKILRDRYDILKTYKENKIGAIATIEGAYFIDEDNYKEILKQLKDLNIKVIGFNWNYSNCLGAGVKEVYSDNKTKSYHGLTDLGIKVLKEMENLGIGIDVSHMNEETFMGIVKNFKGPIIATHSNVYNLANNKRNLKNYQIKSIGDKGGVIGIVFSKNFISHINPSLEKAIDHMEYIIELVGIDHVALGSDFDGTSLPRGLKDASEIYKVTDILLERGYLIKDIQKILGGNYLRVFNELELKEVKIKELDIKIESNIDKNNKVNKNEKIIYIIKGDKNNLFYRIILDGKELENSKLNGDKVVYTMVYPNTELFHILTLEIYNKNKNIKRKTKIIHRH